MHIYAQSDLYALLPFSWYSRRFNRILQVAPMCTPWFVWPIGVCPPNGISIGLAVFGTDHPWQPHTDGLIIFARRRQCALVTNTWFFGRTRVRPANSILFGPVGLRGPMYDRAKFREDRSNRSRYSDFSIFFKMAAVRHVAFAVCVFGPPTNS